MSSVAVVGGGISGLATAYYLNKLGSSVIKQITLLEKSSKLGGWIQSCRYPDGTIHEVGPRSIRPVGTNGMTTLELIEDLGLAPNVIPVMLGMPVTTKRLVLVNGQLHPLPTGVTALFKSTPPFKQPLVRAIFKDLFTKRQEIEDESMYSFARRRLGAEIADYAIDPLCRGVVAGDARQISVQTILKPLFDAEQNHGSIVKGMLRLAIDSRSKKTSPVKSHLVKRAKLEKWRMWNLSNGLQTLPESLAHNIKLSGTKILYEADCERLKFQDDKVQLKFRHDSIAVDHVFASLPAHELKNMLPDQTFLSNLLGKIPFVSVALVNLEYDENQLREEAFGFLVPSNQDSKILGIVYDSCCFPEHNGNDGKKTRLTVMMGGSWYEMLFGNPSKADSDLLYHVATSAVNKHLGISQKPTRSRVFVLKNCIPQYIVGHVKRVREIRECISQQQLPLTLLGSSYDGVSVNDCVHNSKLAVENWLKGKMS